MPFIDLKKALCLVLILLLAAWGASAASAYSESGEDGTAVYPFTGTLPEALAPILSGGGLDGWNVVCGSYSTRFHALNCAQIIAEQSGRYMLRVYFHDGTNWVQAAQSEKALLQGRQPTLIPESWYGANFSIQYGSDSTGACEQFFFFWGSDNWRFQRYVSLLDGAEMFAFDAGPRTLHIGEQALFNAQPVLITEFDAAALPKTWEEAARQSETVPEAQDGTGLTNPAIPDANFPVARMYAQPSGQSDVLMHYYRGVQADVLAETGGYVQIRIGDMEGYVRREEIALKQEKAALSLWNGYLGVTRAQMPEKTIPLYAHTSRDAQVLAHIETMTYVQVLGITPDSQWLQIAMPEENSAIHSLSYNPDALSVPTGFVAITDVTQTSNMHGAAIDNPNPADRLHLRAAPNKGAESLGKYYNGIEVEFLFGTENSDSWRQVLIEGVMGYMQSSFLDFSSDRGGTYLPPLAAVRGTDGGLHLRTAPRADAASIGQYANGTVVEVLSVHGAWGHVRTQEGLSGYMMLQHLGGEPSRAVSATLTVLADTPVYSEQNIASKTFGTLKAGDQVTIQARPMPHWTRPYDLQTEIFGSLALSDDTWLVVFNGEIGGFVPANCVESPWLPK